MTNDSKKDIRQSTDAAIKIVLVVIGGALGLALSYVSLNVLQSEVSKALIEVGKTKASIGDLTRLVKRIEKEEIDLEIADKALDLVRDLSPYSKEVDLARKMEAPIVHGKDDVTLPVRMGDLIEVTMNASAKGKFCFRIKGDENLVETVVDSEQMMIHVPTGSVETVGRIPISTNAIFRAKKEGNASFRVDFYRCWKTMGFDRKNVEKLQITAKILTNSTRSGEGG